MDKLSVNRVGLSVGLFVALLHLVWVGLVASKAAQPVVDFMSKLDFVANPVQIQPFDLVTAVQLVGMTFVLGALSGIIFAAIYNLLFSSPKKSEAKKPAPAAQAAPAPAAKAH